MGVAVEEKYLTIEEYIEFEKTSDSKHEYRDGKLYEMAGAKLPHNLIAGEILILINLLLRSGKVNCRAVGSDQKIYIPSTNRGAFGDVTAFCGKPIFQDDNQFLLTNPTLIVEVLSDGTRSYDKGDKFDHYRALPSFREYVLVEPEKSWVQVRYLKDPENDLWQFSTVTNLEEIVKLQSLGIELKLKDIYEVTNNI